MTCRGRETDAELQNSNITYLTSNNQEPIQQYFRAAYIETSNVPDFSGTSSIPILGYTKRNFKCLELWCATKERKVDYNWNKKGFEI